MDLKLLLLTFFCICVTSSVCESNIGCEIQGDQCERGLSFNVDTIFLGKNVEFFLPKSRNKRKHGKDRKKRIQKDQNCEFKNHRKREKCLKDKKKNISALVEVKPIYSGIVDKNRFIVVEGFSDVDIVGETKLFLSTKPFDGVYKIAQPGFNCMIFHKVSPFYRKTYYFFVLKMVSLSGTITKNGEIGLRIAVYKTENAANHRSYGFS